MVNGEVMKGSGMTLEISGVQSHRVLWQSSSIGFSRIAGWLRRWSYRTRRRQAADYDGRTLCLGGEYLYEGGVGYMRAVHNVVHNENKHSD